MVPQNKKREFLGLLHPQDDEEQQQPSPKRINLPFPSWFGAKLLTPKSLAYVESFFRSTVREEVERKFAVHINLRQSCSSRSIQLEAEVVDEGGGSGMVKLKLCFLNEVVSTIFTTNHIEAENGKPLQVALLDVTNNNKIVATTDPLSSMLVEVVVIDAEFDGKRTQWSVTDFDRSVVTPRHRERPYLVGDDKRIRLKNGVFSINNLSFTTNSKRTRTRNYRLGIRVIDREILSNNNYPRIVEAVSNPFIVMDHKSQGNKKHHPPRGEDEVWRLKGIGRNGEYHKRLSSAGILTVDSFVKAHERDYRSLRKLLGNRVSDKKWKTMVDHAMEYVPVIPTFDPTSFGDNLVQNEAMGGVQVANQNQTFLGEPEEDLTRLLEDYLATLPLQGEASTSNTHNHAENTSACNQYFQGAWNKLVPKPK